MSIGVVGYSVPSGIGYICRGIAIKLGATLWLSPKHTLHGHGALAPSGCRLIEWNDFDESSPNLFAACFADIRVLVSVEDGWHRQMFPVAKAMGVRTVLIVMPEWFNPTKEWTKYVDLFIACTQPALQCLIDYGLGHRTCYVPMPLLLDDFPFRQLTRAERFVFSEGHTNERKGIACVDAANAALGGLIEKRNQDTGPLALASDLWSDADVVVQPSHWEGVGLCLLEAMASGCMLLTTDALPMCAYVEEAYGRLANNALIPCELTTRQLGAPSPWPEAVPNASALADMIGAIRHSDISEYSCLGRNYVEEYHGDRQWEHLRQLIVG